MTEMPREIYVFGDPDSIGDLGFTGVQPKDGHIKYTRADIADELLECLLIMCELLEALGEQRMSHYKLSKAAIAKYKEN